MKNNRLGIFAFVILFMFIMSPGAYAATETSLSVSVANYEPLPVEPGSYFEIWFKVDNTGGDTARDATLIVEPEFPFSIDGDAETSIGILNRLDSTMVKYRINVDSNAVEGTSKLNVKYSADPNTNVMISKSFDVLIRTADADLNIVSMKSNPEQFLPGQKGTAEIIVKNTADSTLKNIKVVMDLSGVTVPFAPIGKSTTSIIKNMAGGSEETITFDIITTPDADSGIYKIPLVITFSDNVGNNYTTSEIISLIIGGAPDLLTNVEADNTFLSGTTGDIRVNIINKGLVDVKYLTVKVSGTDDFNLLSTDEVYIGNIDSDDFDSASFKVNVLSSFSGDLSVPVVFSYMSANNDAFEIEDTLTMKVYTQEEAQSLGLVGSSSKNTIYVILVLGVVGYFIYRRRKKQKSKNK
ncbi:MAG: hypothetical protein GQ477_03645 [Nanohaloarchaea archaeon]|nr:hypothetical protein [Candidatus Nanohaloarchaea archaeon]